MLFTSLVSGFKDVADQSKPTSPVVVAAEQNFPPVCLKI